MVSWDAGGDGSEWQLAQGMEHPLAVPLGSGFSAPSQLMEEG